MGVKTRLTDTLSPGASVLPVALGGVIANSPAPSPVIVTPAIASGPLPLFVIVTLCAALGAPIGWLPKARVPVGLTLACGWTPVSPPASLDQPEAPAASTARTR